MRLGRLQRLAHLFSVLPQYGAAHTLQAGTQAGGLDDEDAGIRRIVGQEEEERLDGTANPQQRIGWEALA